MSMRIGEPGNVQENTDLFKALDSYFAGVGVLMTTDSMADLRAEQPGPILS
jgi:hypothetical protein